MERREKSYRPKMEKWSHKLDYALTVVGWATGIGAIWKFPYMCARNGGGSFLIPFAFFMLIGTIPLTYLESFVGQYSQMNCLGAWQICPALQGLAFGSMILSWIFFITSPTFIAWSFYYLYYSFSAVLPWTLCGQTWNTDNCVADTGQTNLTIRDINVTTTAITRHHFHHTELANKSLAVPAVEEFFRNNLLQITDGIDDLGGIRWPLTGCLFLAYLCIYICIVNGIKVSGKVVYATVSLPYILVTTILIRACTLPGSLEGILYYITPNFHKLLEPKIWVEACGLAIFFIGIGFGPVIKMASHNPIENNCFRDSIVLNLVTTGSVVYIGCSVFAMTGHLAWKRGVTMESFNTSGYKLGFITFPEAASFLPCPQLWSVCHFLMIITLGLDSMIPAVEVVVSVVGALFPILQRRVWFLKGIVVLMSFLLATPYTMQGGVYLLTLIEWFTFFPSLAVFGIFELIAVAWIYGTERIDNIMMELWGKGLLLIVSILWKYVCPCLFLIILGYSFITYRPPKFEEFVYESSANIAGWFLSMAIVLPVPLCFVWTVWAAPGGSLFQKMKQSVQPRGPWFLESTEQKSLEKEERCIILKET